MRILINCENRILSNFVRAVFSWFYFDIEYVVDYLNKILIKTNVATDEGNSRNEM